MRTTHTQVRNISIATLIALLLFVIAGGGSGPPPVPASFAAPLQQSSVAWNPTTSTIDMQAGQQNKQVTVNLVNSGTQTETLQISESSIPSGWNIARSPSDASVTLAAGQQRTFTIVLSAPSNASTGTQTYSLIATDSTGAARTFPLTINVQQAPTSTPTSTTPPQTSKVELSLVSNGVKEGESGGLVTYELRVRNPGNVQGNYKIEFPKSCNDEVGGCTETPSQNTFVIDANSDRNFYVTVILPTDAVAGTIARTRVRAYLESNPNVSSDVELITKVKEAPTPTLTHTPTPKPTPRLVCEDYYEQDDERGTAWNIEVNIPQPKPTTLRDPDEPYDVRTICPPGDEDWLKFGAIRGKVYTIDITDMAEGIDLSLELFDEHGRSLAFNDDFFYRSNVTPSPVGYTSDEDERDPNDDVRAHDIKPRIDSWRAPADGTYYIRVRDAAGRGGLDRTYTIAVRTESYGPTPGIVNEICLDRFEPDGLPEQAALIVSNERQENRSLCPMSDADWVTFFGKAGKRYIIQTDTTKYGGEDPLNDKQAGADTMITLTDRDGVSIIDYNDDIPGGNTFDSELEFRPQTDGFYYMQIKNVGDIGNQFIRYDLKLFLCTEDDTQCGSRATREETPLDEDETSDTNSLSNSQSSNTPTPTIPTEEFSLDATNTPEPELELSAPQALPDADADDEESLEQEPTNTPTAMIADAETEAEPTPTFTHTPMRTVTPVPLPTPTQQPAEAPVSDDPPAADQSDSAATLPDNRADFVHEAFWHIWLRSELPVVNRRVARNWMWGMTASVARNESYAQAQNGNRQVQYFDKGRMEINHPDDDPADPWFVTFGLLAQELIHNRIQVGDNEFLSHPPARIPLVGDATDTLAPTYASFRRIMGNRYPDMTGEVVLDTLDRDGQVGNYRGQHNVILAHFFAETGHNIPDVFWDFLNTQDEIYENGAYRVGPLLDWTYVVGQPITEPYWVNVRLQGKRQDVLIQVYQRRVLAYIPANTPVMQVDMIDVGRHYYEWRYGEPLP